MRAILVGLGAVGQGLLSVLDSHGPVLPDRNGLQVTIVAAVDTSGAVVRPEGLEPGALLTAKRSSQGLGSVRSGYTPGLRTQEVVEAVDADVVVELTPTNLFDGEPAMSTIRGALKAGRHVVTANKGPIALAMSHLQALADHRGVLLRFSATVGGGTPMLDLARLGLRGDRILTIEGILNGTSNFILTRMAEGLGFGAALREAQRLRYAEADPAYDVKGTDAAAKLTILANWSMGADLSLPSVEVRGIEGITHADVDAAAAQEQRVKLLARYDGERATVAPARVPVADELNVPGRMNAVRYTTEHLGRVTLVGPGSGGRETATAVLRDLIDIDIRTRRNPRV